MDYAHGLTGTRRLFTCLALALGLLLAAPTSGLANPITDENALAGNSTWEIGQADAPRIEGYTDKSSVAPGETLGFHVSLNPSSGVNYQIRIYRLGWYNGAGARLVACIGSVVQTPPTCSSTRTGTTKATPAPNAQTGEIDAGWSQSTTWTVPNNATTGEYVAEYVLVSGSSQNGFARYSPFVVRSPNSQAQAQASKILVVVPFNTYDAYNEWGGISSYVNNTNKSVFSGDHAYKVSFNRPFHRREWRFWDYNLVRFLEKEGYDVSYVSDADVDADPQILQQHQAVIVSGHSEYWTQNMRDGFEAARDNGTNLIFAGANDAYWQVRYEDTSCADDNTVCGTVGDRRTMVIYKGPNEGPEDPMPGTANDTSKFRELGRPECELQGGVQYGSWLPNDGFRNYTTTADGAADPWATGTGLGNGSTVTGLVGFEFDSFFPDCDVPGTPKILFTYQGPESPADIDAAAVRYASPGSGARVFSSGTEQWAWGLDNYRWDPTLFTAIPPTNPAIIQFTKNVLADMSGPGSPAVDVTKSGSTFNIDTTPRTDTRVTAFKIYRHAGTGAFKPGDPGVALVCENASGDCADTPAQGTYRYASVAVDQWGESAPTLSAAVDNTLPPTAMNDAATVSEDAAATSVSVLSNDTNPSGQPITISSASDPANGTVVLTGGSPGAATGLTYLPDPNYCNNPPGTSPDTFTYTVNGGSTATVSMTVSCVDDPPVALRDPLSVLEDDPATALNVLANDTDADGGLKEVTSFTQPAHGTVTGVGTAGHWTDLQYQPSANYCNFVNGQGSIGPSDDFTYTLNEGSIATVAMTVDCRDDATVANDDSATVTEDAAATAIPVLANDSDVEGDSFGVTGRTNPAHGTVQITGGGTGLTYQPAANYCGPDSFTYTVTGGDTATVSMTVTCVNDTPDAFDDSAAVNEDAAQTPVPVLANDTDIENDPKTISSATDPAHGTVTLSGGTAGARTTLSYQPDPDYCNKPPGTSLDTFQYTIDGGSSATVSMAVNCVDDHPVANDDAADVSEDASATAVNVLANDTDVDGGPKTIDSVTQPSSGTVAITGGGTGVTYKPNANYCNSPNGTPDSFDYTLNGGSTGQVSMTVLCLDDVPVAVHDSRSVVEDDPATSVDVLINDTDVDGGPKSVASVTQPAHGQVVITGGGTGLTYRPQANYCNFPGGLPSDDFSYTLNGGSSASVSMTVDCVNDAPVANDDTATVSEDAAATAITVLTNDTDVESNAITITDRTQPANGTVVITGGGTGLTYRPTANYCNSPNDPTDDFTYTVNGGDTATVKMRVTCADDPPTAVHDTISVTEDDPATAVPVLANDTDIDAGAKSVNSVTQPSHGTVVRNGDGSGLTYQPSGNYCNTGPPVDSTDDFTYTLNGGSSATVSVTVDCVNDAPAAVDDTKTLSEDASATAVSVLSNDTDVEGDPITIIAKTDPAHGSVAVTGGGTGLTYQPGANYCGPDSFSYTINGGDSAAVSMTITCVDDHPVAVDDTGTVSEDASATSVTVLDNDTDVDSGPKSIDSVDQPSHGSVAITGGGTGLTYRPNANYCNTPSDPTDDFSYTLNGGSEATVSMTVTCVDDDPVAVDDSPALDEDAGTTAIPVLSNDTDIDGGPKTVNSVTQPSHGTVVENGDGSGLTYQPSADYCNTGPPVDSTDDFSYTLNGGDTAAVSVTVTCVDDAPVAIDDLAAVSGNSGPTTIDVRDNDTDIDGGPKTVQSRAQPAHGNVVITNGGQDLTYQPNNGYCSDPPDDPSDDFTYTLNGGATATVSVTVDCSQPPTANDDSATVAQDAPRTAIPVIGNDTDVDGGPLSILATTQPTNGTVAITGGGSGLTYQPDSAYCNGGSPTDNFTYTLNGGDSAMVAMTVTCAPTPQQTVTTLPTAKKCKKGFKRVKGKCKKKKRKRK